MVSSSFALQIVKEELLRNEIVQEFKEKVIALLPENPVRIRYLFRLKLKIKQ